MYHHKEMEDRVSTLTTSRRGKDNLNIIHLNWWLSICYGINALHETHKGQAYLGVKFPWQWIVLNLLTDKYGSAPWS